MPSLYWSTHFNEDGSVNSLVPANSVQFNGSGFPANKTLTYIVSYNAASISGSNPIDANGNITKTITVSNPLIIAFLGTLKAGGGWIDKSSTWVISIAPFTITLGVQ